MTGKIEKFPTSTVHEHRLCIFDPTRRPRHTNRAKVETSHGVILRTGKLGQAHADVLDAICYCAEKRGETQDGRIKLLVDPAKVRKAANITGGRQLEALVVELQAAVIEIKEPVDIACIGHIVDHIDTATRSDGTPVTKPNPLGGERKMWRVELGKAFCKLLESDVKRWYDPTPLAQLNTGIAQAVARHVLSHSTQPPGGWHLDTLISAVGAGSDGVSIRNRRRELTSEAEALAKIGILLAENGRVQHQT